MKTLLTIFGVIFILVGIVWFLQGINVIPGSFMTGNSTYAILGLMLGVIGIILIIFATRRIGIRRE